MILRAFVGILLIVLGWNSYTKTTRKSDFKDYYQASQKFVQGEDIYTFEEVMDLRKKIKSLDELFLPENLKAIDEIKDSVGSYIYPPTFAFLLIPLSDLSYESASRIFGILNYIFLLLSLIILYFHFRKDTEPKIFWGSIALALVFSFRFLENHINNNQVAFILLFLILCSVFSKRAIFSGIALSLAIIIKLTPAVFLVYFFWKKRWASIAFTFLFLVGWALLPGLYSWEDNLRYMGNWNDMVLNNAMKNPVFRSWQNNQSIIATLAKYFLPYADINQPIYKMPWIELSQGTVKVLFNFIFIIFGLALLKSLYGNFQKPSKGKTLSLLFILSVLFSGIAWIHSFSFFLFPLIYIFREYLSGGLSPKEKKWFFTGLAFLFLTNRNFIGGMGESSALMVSTLLYGGVILFFLIANYTEIDSSTQGPIRIAVDARPLAFGLTGNSRYLAEVLTILGKEKEKYQFLLLSHKGIHPVFQDILSLPAVSVVAEKSWIPGPLWLHTVFPILSYVNRADILWGTLQLLPAFGKSCPMIVNYHDLNVKSAPTTMAKWNLFQHKLLCGRTLKKADSILCLSQNTINDISRFYPRRKEKCVLVYPGVSPAQSSQAPEDFAKFGKFLFTLGTLEPRKNLKTLISAYLELKEEHPNYPFSLVAAGRAGWGLEENLLREALLRGEYKARGVFFLENPKDETLSWLYQNNVGFLFPSIHEGFGLPLLEAMREGKNCIASDIPVFSEILDEKFDRKVKNFTDSTDWKEVLLVYWKNPPSQRKWDPNDWTWEHTSEKIAGEIQKLHVI